MIASLARHAVCAVTLGALLGLAASATAQEYIVRNDSMDNSFSGRIATAELDPEEGYFATFEIPDHLLPAELLGVQVIMVNGDQGGVAYCGRFTIEVYEESTAVAADSPHCTTGGVVQLRQKEPGNVIYSMSNQFQADPLGFQLRGDPNNLQEMRFSTINSDPTLNVTINPVMLETKKVRVGIKALDTFCTPTAGQAFPVIVTDQTETSDNFLYGYLPLLCTPPNMHYLWRDFQNLFSSPTGDFVMRLILRDPTYTGGGDDVGGGEPDVGMGELDAGDEGEDAYFGKDVEEHLEPDVGAGDVGSGVGNDDVGGSNPGLGDTGDGALLAITSISPASATNTASTNVVILGQGFLPGAQVLLGAESIGVTETLSERIRATVPEGLGVGIYDVIVTNPGGQSALLAEGFTVIAGGEEDNDDEALPPGGSGVDGVEDGCGCRLVAGPSAPPTSLLAGLIGLFAIVRLGARRRR